MSLRSGTRSVPTMQDVAKKAGVSTATVSLALRNHSAIKQATRERVLRAQNDLGYKLNRDAQQLRHHGRRSQHRRKLEELAFALVGIQEEGSYVPFLHGIIREAQARHLRVLTQTFHMGDGGEQQLPSALRDGHVDGVIISGMVDDAAIALLVQHKIPCVVLGNYAVETRVPRVEIDLRQVTSMLVRKLRERNHQHIAFVLDGQTTDYERGILEGVQSALAKNGLSLPDSHLVVTSPSVPVGTTFINAYDKLDPKPTAVIVPNSLIAGECVSELRARRIEVPGQVDVVSLVATAQDAKHKRYHVVNLALERAGRVAVQRLAELVEQPDNEPTITVLTVDDWLPAAEFESTST